MREKGASDADGAAVIVGCEIRKVGNDGYARLLHVAAWRSGEFKQGTAIVGSGGVAQSPSLWERDGGEPGDVVCMAGANVHLYQPWEVRGDAQWDGLRDGIVRGAHVGIHPTANLLSANVIVEVPLVFGERTIVRNLLCSIHTANLKELISPLGWDLMEDQDKANVLLDIVAGTYDGITERYMMGQEVSVFLEEGPGGDMIPVLGREVGSDLSPEKEADGHWPPDTPVVDVDPSLRAEL